MPLAYGSGKSGRIHREPTKVSTSEPTRSASEVRVGRVEPTALKPTQRMTARERHQKRSRDIAEAAEIAANMKARKAEKGVGRGGRKKRPVLVDGVWFESVTAASVEIGTSAQCLGNMLRGGAKTCKGRRIEFAKE